MPQDYLDSLVEVDNDLGRVAAEEDHHDRHQQARHRAVPAQLDYHIYKYTNMNIYISTSREQRNIAHSNVLGEQ